jgi:hypothetical protein
MSLWLCRIILLEHLINAWLQTTPLFTARQAARVVTAPQSAFDDSFVDSALQERKKPK